MLYDVNNSLIYGNTMTENSLAGLAIDLEDSEFMSHIGLVRSMESPESGNNTIYNNYFKNINNTLINSEANNTWNISKTSGESIVGGPYLGGNYWANPNGTGFSQNCIDADKDGIADSSYEIVNGTFDYLPLRLFQHHTKALPITFLRVEIPESQVLTAHRRGLLQELRQASTSIILFPVYWDSVSLPSSTPEMSL
ncbi:NosD domain-containing protein [Methanosarcina horonobensis]|uniref:NosD domain-containing protein n=1 Tax=Methanosarcina horonobensis TaxID=418008 RepID=UPI0022B8C1E9|nr:NosD domain-containing protein [Methanosarcina horonobensis]